MACIVTIRKLDYQRNGISGEGFFQALIDFKEKDDSGTGLIATFETKADEDGNEIGVNQITTRVIDPLDFNRHWRGDSLGYDIEAALNKLKTEFKVEGYYDIKEVLNLREAKYLTPLGFEVKKIQKTRTRAD